MRFTASRLSRTLRLKYPLIVAPMAGGPSSTELVVSASEAGALGSIAAAYLPANAIKDFTKQVREKTQLPFAINLFVPSKIPTVSEDRLQKAINKTQKFRDEFGLPAPRIEPPYEEDFSLQFEAVLALRPPVLSFVFGLLPPECMIEARKLGIYLIGTATSADEACALEESGVDAIVAQGIEAGGHRGIFEPSADDPNVPMLDLVKDAKRRTKLPVIAAGGIMMAKDVRVALAAGADAVQMGTAFLATKEAGTIAPYREKVLEPEARKTRTTRAFSGRLARGIVNRFMEEMDDDLASILPFPAQNKFTRDLRNASASADNPDFLSLWCGTGQGHLWTGSAGELVQALFAW